METGLHEIVDRVGLTQQQVEELFEDDLDELFELADTPEEGDEYSAAKSCHVTSPAPSYQQLMESLQNVQHLLHLPNPVQPLVALHPSSSHTCTSPASSATGSDGACCSPQQHESTLDIGTGWGSSSIAMGTTSPQPSGETPYVCGITPQSGMEHLCLASPTYINHSDRAGLHLSNTPPQPGRHRHFHGNTPPQSDMELLFHDNTPPHSGRERHFHGNVASPPNMELLFHGNTPPHSGRERHFHGNTTPLSGRERHFYGNATPQSNMELLFHGNTPPNSGRGRHLHGNATPLSGRERHFYGNTTPPPALLQYQSSTTPEKERLYRRHSALRKDFMRKQLIRSALDDLKQMLPTDQCLGRQTKAGVINNAADYIDWLQKEIQRLITARRASSCSATPASTPTKSPPYPLGAYYSPHGAPPYPGETSPYHSGLPPSSAAGVDSGGLQQDKGEERFVQGVASSSQNEQESTVFTFFPVGAEFDWEEEGETIQSDVEEVEEVRRPQNGFIRFSVRYRRLVQNQHPNMDNREISRILGSKWRKMTDEEKRPFTQEFFEEMEKIRNEHPCWNYGGVRTPKTSTSKDKSSPIPTRLRPRESELAVEGTTTGKKRKYKRKSPVLQLVNQAMWVQCDTCDKWRQLSPETHPQELPDKWYCQMNKDPNFNSCEAPEVPWDDIIDVPVSEPGTDMTQLFTAIKDAPAVEDTHDAPVPQSSASPIKRTKLQVSE
ncbi:uncharacterized protein [Branchiostoma lanceolatum]|uniref:uncharacterized protein n=1 Tax=Branchiostoma lanceolatum TaxID=7740 RepID=UPI00345290AA